MHPAPHSLPCLSPGNLRAWLQVLAVKYHPPPHRRKLKEQTPTPVLGARKPLFRDPAKQAVSGAGVAALLGALCCCCALSVFYGVNSSPEELLSPSYLSQHHLHTHAPVPTTTPEEKIKRQVWGRKGKEQKTKVRGGEGRGDKKRRNGAGKGREEHA